MKPEKIDAFCKTTVHNGIAFYWNRYNNMLCRGHNKKKKLKKWCNRHHTHVHIPTVKYERDYFPPDTINCLPPLSVFIKKKKSLTKFVSVQMFGNHGQFVGNLIIIVNLGNPGIRCRNTIFISDLYSMAKNVPSSIFSQTFLTGKILFFIFLRLGHIKINWIIYTQRPEFQPEPITLWGDKEKLCHFKIGFKDKHIQQYNFCRLQQHYKKTTQSGYFEI